MSHSKIPRSTSGLMSPILPVGTSSKANKPSTSARSGGEDLERSVFEQDCSSSLDDAEDVGQPFGCQQGSSASPRKGEVQVHDLMNELNKEIEANSCLTFDNQESRMEMDDSDCVVEFENIVGYIPQVKPEPVSGTIDEEREKLRTEKTDKKLNSREKLNSEEKAAAKKARKEAHEQAKIEKERKKKENKEKAEKEREEKRKREESLEQEKKKQRKEEQPRREIRREETRTEKAR